MKKTIGQYTIKLDANSNLITVTNKGEMIYGKAVKAADTGSHFDTVCNSVLKMSQSNC
jgi:hypothetical protein